MKKTIGVMVFVFVAASASAQTLRVEATTAPANGFGHLSVTGGQGVVMFDTHLFRLEHGTIGVAGIATPIKVFGKHLTLEPGIYNVYGRHETGPGAGLRWRFKAGPVSSEGFFLQYVPITRSTLVRHTLADPLDVDVLLFKHLGPKWNWLKELKLGYTAEIINYGKDAEQDNHQHQGLQGKQKVSERCLVFGGVLFPHAVRAGLACCWGPGCRDDEH